VAKNEDNKSGRENLEGESSGVQPIKIKIQHTYNYFEEGGEAKRRSDPGPNLRGSIMIQKNKTVKKFNSDLATHVMEEPREETTEKSELNT